MENTTQDPIKKRIEDGAKELFFSRGIKSTTMDDIAKELGVSKKTIYNHFKDKDSLVKRIGMLTIEEDKQWMTYLEEIASNTVEYITMFSICLRGLIKEVAPHVFYDLQKYHRKAFEEINRFKMEFMLTILRKNLEQGKQEGYYREDLDIDVISRLRIGTFDLVMFTDLFPMQEFECGYVHMQLFEHFIHGLLTPKGLELYQHYKNQYNDNQNLSQSILQKIQENA